MNLQSISQGNSIGYGVSFGKVTNEAVSDTFSKSPEPMGLRSKRMGGFMDFRPLKKGFVGAVILGMAGTAGGAVLGANYGGPAGAALGAVVGGGAGTVAGFVIGSLL